VAVAAISSLLMALVGWGEARLFRFGRKLESAFILSVVLVNAGNYGLPLKRVCLRRAGLQRAIVFYVVTSVVSNTLGCLPGLPRGGFGPSLLAKCVIGSTSLRDRTRVCGQCDRDGTAGSPVAGCESFRTGGGTMYAAYSGVAALAYLGKGSSGPHCAGNGHPPGLAPLIAFALVDLLGLSGLARQVTIIEASMPTAVMGGVLATEFGSDAQFTTAVILVSTLASIVTLSVLLSVLM